MDILLKIRSECDNPKNWREDNSSVCSMLEEQSDLPLIRMENEDRLQHLETQLRIATIDVEKKILNAYKNLLKVKWLLTDDGQIIEGLIFNDKTAYVKHIKLQTSNPHLTDELWQKISEACKDLY